MAENKSQYFIDFVARTLGFENVKRDLAKIDNYATKLTKMGGKLGGVQSFAPQGYKFRQWEQMERSGKMGQRSAWFDPSGKRIPASQVPTQLQYGPIQRQTIDITEKQIKAYKEKNKVQQEAEKQNQKHGKSLVGLASRAMAVIPIWLALRTVYMSLISFVSANIKAWTELEIQMSRVATVTRGTKDDLNAMKDAVVSYTATSTASFKDVANTMYALGSAGLNVTEQMAGFKHIMDLTIGSFGNAEQIAKLVAGSYNVFGNSIDDVYTKSEKFKKMSDILAYTYSTQQVELSEIATAMTYVGSVGTLLDVKFEDLVGTIGFLNTGMLKGTKAGTSLFNAFIRLASESDKLGEIGVRFDPSQPLDFVNVMTQLSDIYGKQALSLDALRELMDVFGRRGGRAIAQIISDFERWQDTIEGTGKNFEDFAAKMRKEAEDNLPKAFQKLGNAIKASFIEGIGEAGGLKDFINTYTRGIEAINKAKKYSEFLSAGTKFELETTKAAYGFAAPLLIGGSGGVGKEVNKQLGGNEELLAIYNKVVNAKEYDLDLTEKISRYQKDLNILGEALAKHPEKEAEVREALAMVLNRELGNREKYLKFSEKITEEVFKQIEAKAKDTNVDDDRNRELEKQLKLLERNASYSDMQVKGVLESNIEYAKLKDLITDVNKIIKETVAKEQIKPLEEQKSVILALRELDIRKLINGEYDDLHQAIKHTNVNVKDGLEVQKQSLDTMRKLKEEAREFSDVLRDSLTDSFKGMLSGESDIGDLFENLTNARIEAYRDMVSEGFSDLMMATGFGDNFAGAMQNARTGLGLIANRIEKSFNRGGQITYDYIVRAFSDSTGAVSAGGSTTATWGGSGGMFGGIGAALRPFGQYQMVNGQLMVPHTTDYGNGLTGTTYKPANVMQSLGYYGVQGAVTGYSAFQSAQAGGIPMGQSIASGLLTGIGSGMFGAGAAGMGTAMAGGAGMMAALGPVGWIGLGIMAVGMALGMFGGKDSSWSRTETKTTERRISSRIDVTNKNLEIINRNLVALRQELTYIMPRSYYFSERSTIEDDFSLDRRRGAEA